jgi:hypothetical protein
MATPRADKSVVARLGGHHNADRQESGLRAS